MFSQKIHQYNHGQLLARVRRRSAIFIFLAFAFFFAIKPSQKTEICNNGKDDNEDGWVDCQDPMCKNFYEDCLQAESKMNATSPVNP